MIISDYLIYLLVNMGKYPHEKLENNGLYWLSPSLSLSHFSTTLLRQDSPGAMVSKREGDLEPGAKLLWHPEISWGQSSQLHHKTAKGTCCSWLAWGQEEGSKKAETAGACMQILVEDLYHYVNVQSSVPTHLECWTGHSQGGRKFPQPSVPR